MTLETTVDLLLDPVPTFGLICLDVHIVDKSTYVVQGVDILKELRHIVSDLLFVAILEFKLLLKHLADPIHKLANVIIVKEGLGCLITGELKEHDGMSFIHECSLSCLIDLLYVVLLLLSLLLLLVHLHLVKCLV